MIRIVPSIADLGEKDVTITLGCRLEVGAKEPYGCTARINVHTSNHDAPTDQEIDAALEAVRDALTDAQRGARRRTR